MRILFIVIFFSSSVFKKNRCQWCSGGVGSFLMGYESTKWVVQRLSSDTREPREKNTSETKRCNKFYSFLFVYNAMMFFSCRKGDIFSWLTDWLMPDLTFRAWRYSKRSNRILFRGVGLNLIFCEKKLASVGLQLMTSYLIACG